MATQRRMAVQPSVIEKTSQLAPRSATVSKTASRAYRGKVIFFQFKELPPRLPGGLLRQPDRANMTVSRFAGKYGKAGSKPCFSS